MTVRTTLLSALLSAVALITFVFAASDRAAAQPSWCFKSGLKAAEETICSSQYLISLDGALNTAYRRALFDSPNDRRDIRARQRDWLFLRNGCGFNEACIASRYRTQIGYLEGFFAN
ncbi:MAG: hypothetical protein AAFR70_05505 [Pseudomonadota bacterium]